MDPHGNASECRAKVSCCGLFKVPLSLCPPQIRQFISFCNFIDVSLLHFKVYASQKNSLLLENNNINIRSVNPHVAHEVQIYIHFIGKRRPETVLKSCRKWMKPALAIDYLTVFSGLFKLVYIMLKVLPFIKAQMVFVFSSKPTDYKHDGTGCGTRGM